VILRTTCKDNTVAVAPRRIGGQPGPLPGAFWPRIGKENVENVENVG